MPPISAPCPTTGPDANVAPPEPAPIQRPATLEPATLASRSGGAATRRAKRPAAQRQSARQSQPGAGLLGESQADGLRLPCAGDGERALPHARREKHRAAEAGGSREDSGRAHHARGVCPNRA
jgi:hypothetical protein